MEFAFSNPVLHWRGPSPFHFLPVPQEMSDEIRAVSGALSYGWGCIPVRATIGDTTWTTSLMPKDGRYLLPLRDKIRAAEGLEVDERVHASIALDLP